MIQENFIKIYEKSFKKNWELPALTDYSKGTTFSFADVAKEIARIHILFEECQIRRGDKIALIGKDSARWCIVYMAYYHIRAHEQSRKNVCRPLLLKKKTTN